MARGKDLEQRNSASRDTRASQGRQPEHPGGGRLRLAVVPIIMVVITTTPPPLQPPRSQTTASCPADRTVLDPAYRLHVLASPEACDSRFAGHRLEKSASNIGFSCLFGLPKMCVSVWMVV